MFYINGVKTVPINIADCFRARAFPYWIMDDGSLGGKGLLLHTNSIRKEGVNLLIEGLEKNLNIKSEGRKKYNK